MIKIFMIKNKIYIVVAFLFVTHFAQASEFDSLEYRAEASSTMSRHTTPLWLNSNRYGLSSLHAGNGYVRGGIFREESEESRKRELGWSAGADVAVAWNNTSTLILQQLYAEGRWLHGTLTIGAKQQPMELKNERLSSGSQALGINARPVPQVRIALPEYVKVFPWLGVKGHIAYGWLTDQEWERDFAGSRGNRWSQDVRYHSKAGYLRLGKVGKPFSAELGLEMAAEFGGVVHDPVVGDIHMGDGLKDYWDALIGGGSDPGEGIYGNVDGNQLGAYVFRLNYDREDWALHFYGDHFFEDHSAMFHLDYDGYHTDGDNIREHVDRRYVVYDMKDMMLGVELNLKKGTWVKDVVVEYLYTKYQSGPVYHDNSSQIADHIAGRDNYYNHGRYTGWQHWGMVMGNPLYRSPLYNSDHLIQVENNRFVAFHMGVYGEPMPTWSYRVLGSWEQSLGTYGNPYVPWRYDTSLLVEVAHTLSKGWCVKGGYGLDHGKLLGNNIGLQLTVTKRGLLRLKKNIR